MNEEVFPGIEIEDKFEGIIIEEDETITEYPAKPGIEFNFESEAELKDFMGKIKNAAIVPEKTLCFVKNVSLSFFNGFQDATAAVSETLPEYEQDDLSD